MKYTNTMAENITARYDAMREIRDAKEKLKQLESQWADIVDEVKQQNILEWLNFCYGGEDVKTKTWEQVADQWENKNAGWKVVGNGLRKVSITA